jgi:hypothetical protein
MISTNHSTQPDHCSAGAGRDAWAIVVARRVGAEPVSRCARRSGPPRQCRALPSTRRTDSQPASKRPASRYISYLSASSEGDRRAEEGSRALLGYVLQAATVARRPRRVPRVSYIRLAEVFRAPLLARNVKNRRFCDSSMSLSVLASMGLLLPSPSTPPTNFLHPGATLTGPIPEMSRCAALASALGAHRTPHAPHDTL